MTPFLLGYYILDEHQQPVAVDDDDWATWAMWMEEARRTNTRRVAQDMDENDTTGLKIRVSTVFLGLDHGFYHGDPRPPGYKPVLWETMVFGGVLDGEQDRYTSLDDAIRGHQDMCRRVSETIHR